MLIKSIVLSIGYIGKEILIMIVHRKKDAEAFNTAWRGGYPNEICVEYICKPYRWIFIAADKDLPVFNIALNRCIVPLYTNLLAIRG
jgi:hypothetical protein